MTKHATPHVPTMQQAVTAQNWRKLVGPGTQFPVMTDRVLGFWPNHRRD